MSTDSHNDAPPSKRPAKAAPPSRRKHHWWSLFLASLAGFDLHLLEHYTGAESEHERKKLVLIGASVLIPSLLSFFACCFVLTPHVTSLPIRVACSLVVAAFILFLDCVVVVTLSSSGRAGLTARILLSLCLSVAIADPLVAALFGKTIRASIEAQLGAERAAEEKRLNAKLKDEETQASVFNTKIEEGQVKLEAYTPGNIASGRIKQAAVRREEMVSAVRNSKMKEEDELNDQLELLQKQQRELETQIEATLIAMQQERDGKRATKKPGEGPVFLQLRQQLESLRLQHTTLAQQISDVEKRLNSLRNDKAEEIRAASAADVLAAGSAESTQMTPEEQSKREQLVTQMTELTSSLADLQIEAQQTRKEIAELPRKFDLSRRDDPLSQTRALITLAQESPLMLWKIATLMTLLLLFDMTPVLVKLTVSTGYGEYIQSLARDHSMASAPIREKFDSSVMESADHRLTVTADYAVRAVQRLEYFKPLTSDSRHTRSAKDRISREIERQVKEAILVMRGGHIEEKQEPVLSLIYSAIKNAWSAFRARFGLSTS